MVEVIFNSINSVNGILYGYIIISLLLCAGIYFSVKSRFAQFTLLKDMIALILSREKHNKEEGLSPFQAFCVSTASRVGTGNMVGVAIAIGTGGPGAVFWMWLIALIGSASSIVESILAQLYKTKGEDGKFIGGPAYYMERGLKSKKMAAVFALSTIGFIGLANQSVLSNSIASVFKEAYNVDTRVTTVILMIVVSLVIFGSLTQLVRFCEKIVPVMATIYIGVAAFVILKNISVFPQTILLIVKSAMGLEQAFGGMMGAALMNGIKRGLYSNEAGMGTAPNAAAAASTSHPVKQALIQAFGVFTDTIIICGATSFIILLAGKELYTTPGLGVALIQLALVKHIGIYGKSFIALCILLFSFSTIMGTYFYAMSNMNYLTKKRRWQIAFKVGIIFMIALGGVAQTTFVWALGDLLMGIMTLINVVSIILLSKKAFIVLEDYRYQRSLGRDPVFDSSSIEELQDLESWNNSRLKPQSASSLDELRAS